MIEGKEGDAGIEETQELIEMIFETNEVAAFFVRQLYIFFVSPEIDEWTETNIIQPLAQTFRDNDYVVKPVIEELLLSDHFYDEVNYGAIIKAPTDVMLGFYKGMNAWVPFDEEAEIMDRRALNTNMMWNMDAWGMQIGDPPNVAGWPAYFQIPTFDKTWVTTHTCLLYTSPSPRD